MKSREEREEEEEGVVDLACLERFADVALQQCSIAMPTIIISLKNNWCGSYRDMTSLELKQVCMVVIFQYHPYI